MYNFGVFFGKALAFIFIVSVLILPARAEKPVLSAQSAILINQSNGEIVAEYNADNKQGMASTTKIMTAIIAIECGNLNQKYKIPSAATGIEGSSLYLKPGEEMTLRELIVGLMLRSANDAAEAIAIIVGGNTDNFVKMMNDKALSLGLTQTNFTNPHGLADENHYTTARELAKITSYALKNETFRSICSMKSATLPGIEYQRQVSNHNKMLSMYDGALGVKTGFTKATGRCLVSAAQRDGIELIAVTLNAPNDWADHKAMLDFGFSQYENIKLAAAGEIVFDLPLIGGDSDYVPVYIKKDISVCLKKNHGSITKRIELINPRFAPVYIDDIVGKIVFSADGKEIASSPLYASHYVGIKQQNKSFWERILN